jgi:hypothetical protein
MKFVTTRQLLATFLVAAVSATASAQPTIYDWVATEAVANWNVETNWNGPAGNFVPNADNFEGESALVNNGRTALANEKVPPVAALEVRNGAVEIPQGGAVETVVDNDNNGGLLIGAAGTVSLGGNGQLTVGGSTSNAGTLSINGSQVQMSVAGDFGTTGTLVAGIGGDSHSAISVAGEATLGGILRVDIEGAAPTFGQSWDLLTAASISGRFRSVDTGGAATPRGLQYQVASNNGTASLLVGNALIATVDRQSGAGQIENVVGGPINITGYALRSGNGLLSAANWSSASESGALGEGWRVANPAESHLSELNLTNSFNLDVGATISLGSPYDGGPATPAEEDVTFEYTTLDGNVHQGIVEYTGALNEIVLHVDPSDGAAAIANLSRFIGSPDLTSYAVRSASGAINTDSWTSFADTGAAGEGWTEANPTNNHIAELNLENTKAMSNGTVLELGNIFSSGGEQDLLFEYTTLDGQLFRGTVQYGAIPGVGMLPGDCNGDGQVNADDLSCVGDITERDVVLAALNTLPGDFNGNGDVAFSDFLVLSANFGDATKTLYTEGNVDLMNGVGFPDFLVLSANFGKTPGAVGAAVPEPSAGVMLSLALMLLCGCRGRRDARRE